MAILSFGWGYFKVESTLMNTNHLNYLNIGLMFLSAGFAFVWPFESFLFVYAFLGPLHYLTEISWLHERQYFTQKRYDYLYLLIATGLLTLGGLGLFPGLPKAFGEGVALWAFGMALIFVFFKTFTARAVAGVVLVLACGWMGSVSWLIVLFGIFVPTLIHVFVFTGAFILLGALRSRSLSGFLSLLVFVALSASFFLWHPAHAGYQVSSYVMNNYGTVESDGTMSNPFLAVNLFFAKIFHLEGFPAGIASPMDYAQAINGYLYHYPVALGLMAFIAYAYTYHYLNWFSKTSIIGWYQVPKARLILVGVLWVVSVGLYLVNYNLGLRWLLLLSLAHVLLEFPLNHLTFWNIGRMLFQKPVTTE